MVILENAWCKGCGYHLRGLPQPVCPECGRSFDSDDTTTFDVISPYQYKRKRIKRTIISLIILIPLVAFFPRGIDIASITYTCKICSEKKSSKRYELYSPRWLHLRYPGIYWPGQKQLTPQATHCKRHLNQITVRLYTRTLWNLSGTPGSRGSATPAPGSIVFVNEFDATKQNDANILNSLMKRQYFAIGAH